MESCPICRNEIKYSSLGGKDAYSVNCPLCGEYALSRTALVNIRNTELTNKQRICISGWLINNQNYEINSVNFDGFLVNLTRPSFIERSDNLLRYISQEIGTCQPHMDSYLNN